MILDWLCYLRPHNYEALKHLKFGAHRPYNLPPRSLNLKLERLLSRAMSVMSAVMCGIRKKANAGLTNLG